MKIGLVSDFSHNDTKNNLATILKYLSEGHDMDLFLFLEGFLQGFNALEWDYEKDIKIALSQDDPCLETIKNAYKVNRVSVGFGYYEKDGPLIYCSYLVIDQKGNIVNNYRRLSDGWKLLSKVTSDYRNGTSLLPFSLHGKKFLTVLCGDLWDDDLKEKVITTITKEKINFLLWPSHLDYPIGQFKKELPDYAKRTKEINIPTLLVNDHSSSSFGGAVVFLNGEISSYLEVGSLGELRV